MPALFVTTAFVHADGGASVCARTPSNEVFIGDDVLQQAAPAANANIEEVNEGSRAEKKAEEEMKLA